MAGMRATLALAILLAGAGGCHTAGAAAGPFDGGTFSDGGAAVLTHHEHPSRDGQYIDPALTHAAAARMRRDTAFSGAIAGHVYAQPLYLESAGSGRPDMLIVATESNQVNALDPTSGAIIWQRTLGSPVPLQNLPCGNVDPLGITGTPVIDAAAGALYLDAMTMAGSPRHLVHALSLADGSALPGWPLDVQAALAAQGVTFDSSVQNQRGALALVSGALFVPYGGHYGDCGDYFGWVLSIPVASPADLRAWHTRARGGGSWAVGGIASDGSSVYASTGNTFGASAWSDGEAIFRFGAAGSGALQPLDSFAPANWKTLDDGDIDLGGCGPVLVHVPGGAPADVVVALGKDGYAYILDRAHLGGIGGQLSFAQVSNLEIIQAATAFTAASGAYVAFHGNAPGGSQPGCDGGTDLAAFRLTAAAPPAPLIAWCARQNGAGSPISTTTDGASEPLVWSIGAEGDSRLRAFDGETGAAIFAGGGATDGMGTVRRFSTPIAARGRIYVAGDDQVYAFAISP
jgi:hypothetical protein